MAESKIKSAGHVGSGAKLFSASAKSADWEGADE